MTDTAWHEIENALQERGDAPLLTGSDAVSGNEAVGAILNAGRRLDQLSLLAGETVGVLVEPSAACLLAMMALWQRGLVALPLNPREPTGVLDELAWQHFRVLLHPRAIDAPAIGETLALALEDLVADGDALPDVATLPPTPPYLPIPGAATAVRTSGSSGENKLVIHSLRQHMASARAASSLFDLDARHTWTQSLPLYHVGGLAILFRALVSGARIALPATGERAEDAFRRLRTSHVSLVATQLGRLLADDDGRAALVGAEVVLCGGGPASEALRRRAIEAGVPLVVSYGMTETASMIAAERAPSSVVMPRVAGRAVPGARIEVASDGEILVGGDPLMLGYLGLDGLRDPRTAEGLFATGDLGHLDDEGRLHVSGRADEMFISGGENIHPAEIEDAVCSLEGIEEAVVVPIDDAEFGQRPVAFLRSSAVPAIEDLVAHLEARLPRFKIPLHFWDMPEDERLKRDRATLRDLAAASMRQRKGGDDAAR